VNFTSNTAANGGAIYGDISDINFTGSDINFTSNTAGNGGAIHAYYNAKINFASSMANFTGNNADQYGGAISAGNNSNINFTSATVNFASNKADSGGAIYALDNSTINFTSSTVHFTGNIAISSGGALYNGGLLNLGAAEGSTITFVNNRAVVGKDIYGVNGSVMNINGLGDISFGGGIEGAGTINKTNTGNVYFEAGSKTD
jgi:predicted outer membrane repeat protein